jgi:glycosyltransferase involved in cell wall biosynthesis
MSDLSGLRIAYLCLQATTPGQASYAHVHEIIAGLRDLGAAVDLFEPSYADGSHAGVVKRLYEFARVQTRLVRRLGEYDVLYVRGHPLAWPTARCAHRRRLTVVQECNGMVDDFFIAWPAARRFVRLITTLTYAQFRQADRVVVGSAGLAAWLERVAGVQAAVVPNGANVEVFRPMPRPAGVQLPERYAVFFGSLAPWQGLATSLAAVGEPSWPDGVSLVVLGSGALQAEVVAAAEADERIKYLGIVPYDEVAPILSNAVCSLVNKEQPEFAQAGISPLKLYESMACGVPVVATYGMPGLTEVVADGQVGLLVPQGDPDELARAVATLAKEPALAAEMGARARKLAVEECSWQARSREIGRIIVEASAPV